MIRHLRLATLVSLTALIAACSKGGGTGGGSNPPDNRPCTLTASAGAWTAANTTLSVAEPRSCPYTTAAIGSSMAVRAHLIANAERSGVPGVTASHVVDWRILSSDGVTRFQTATTYSQYDPGTDRRGTTLQSTYPSGHGSPVRDSLSAQFGVTGYGTAFGYAILPGKVDASSSGGFVGATTVIAGISATWRVVPLNDTVSYTYEWKVDGSLVGSTAQITKVFGGGETGDHTLSVDVIKADDTRYTVSRTIFVAGNCGGVPCP